ncbi:MAG: hypothetical protein FWD53_06845 [Phycisphaerales bacterium]|nr:hypothetical protein [Phycisphaerales bacterium]
MTYVEDKPSPSATIRTEAQVKERFDYLFAAWERDTALHSNYSIIITHPAYLGILGLGLPAVPHLLRKLSGGGGPLIVALEAITGENPIPPEHEVDSKLMVADWLKWGREHGVI